VLSSKMTSDSDNDTDQGIQVRVSLKLASSVQDRSLEVPTEPIAVPADVGRKGLSAVLNHLLGRAIVKDEDGDDDDGEDDASGSDGDDEDKLPPLTFEFIVSGTNNRLLRKGVESEARQHGLSLEEAITITYFPASNSPKLLDDDEKLPDWISCLSAPRTNHKNNLLVSGCYDGAIHLYKRSNSNDKNGLIEVNFATAATGPIKALATTMIDDTLWIASASLDHSLNVHTYRTGTNQKDEGILESHGQCTQPDNDILPSNAFSSLDFASAQSRLLASGNADGVISIWDVQKVHEETTSVSDKKKQKTSSANKKKGSSKREIAAIVNMQLAHSQLVSGLSWGNHHYHQHSSSCGDNNAVGNDSHLISGSWDHSIKLWDVEKQNCLLTLNGARVVSCLDTSYHSEGVVATGHPDCTIRLWDVRFNHSKQSAILADTTFRPSHKAWISSVQWSPTNAYQLVSTSHDSTVKLWDIRSSNPLYTVRAFPKTEKGLCLQWASPKDGGEDLQTIYAGGTDCRIKQLEL
jgi:ribosome biogenesis protein YTM1